MTRDEKMGGKNASQVRLSKHTPAALIQYTTTSGKMIIIMIILPPVAMPITLRLPQPLLVLVLVIMMRPSGGGRQGQEVIVHFAATPLFRCREEIMWNAPPPLLNTTIAHRHRHHYHHQPPPPQRQLITSAGAVSLPVVGVYSLVSRWRMHARPSALNAVITTICIIPLVMLRVVVWRRRRLVSFAARRHTSTLCLVLYFKVMTGEAGPGRLTRDPAPSRLVKRGGGGALTLHIPRYARNRWRGRKREMNGGRRQCQRGGGG